jgi:hydrogenase nickel incorporation protein HypA/HybF
MHEMSLAESVLQIIEEAAIAQKFTRVKTVWLEIGQLSCVEKEAMQFCFDAVMCDSIAAHSKLEIISVAGEGWCETCACTVPITTLHEVCRNCGSYGLKISAGDAMRVKELEVE